MQHGDKAGRGAHARRRMVSPVLVGRNPEVHALTDALAAPPALLVIEGEAGVGKTRLTNELRRQPAAKDLTHVVGGCRRIRDPFPLGPIIEALRDRAGDLRASALSPVAGAARPLLPELARVLPPQPAALNDRQAERHQLFRGFAELFIGLGPAMLVLEDLHWADEQTVDFLHYLLADPPDDLVGVLTYRGEEVPPDVQALIARPPESVTLAHIRLAPLDATAIGAQVAAILGTDAVSTELVSYLCERSSGVPFAVEELLALMQSRGTLMQSAGGGWSWKALDDLGVPTGIRDSVLERLRRLSPDARGVIEAAAVLQAPVSISVLGATCPDQIDAAAGVEEGLRSGLLVEDAGQIGFRHVLASQAVYANLPLPAAQAFHGRAARALRGAHPVPLGQVAHHARHCGDHYAWAVAAEQAANQATAFENADEATRMLEDVVRHASIDPVSRGRIAAKLGRTASESGTSHVKALLTEVVAQDLPLALRGEVRFWLAMLMFIDGSGRRQFRQFAQAVDELHDRPDLRAWAMVNLGLPMYPGVPFAEHLQWLQRAQTALGQVDDRRLEVLLLGKIAMVLVAVGDPQWRTLTDRILALTHGSPHGRLEVSAFHDVACDAVLTGHHDFATHLLDIVRATGPPHGRDRPAMFLRTATMLVSFCTGQWHGLPDEISSLLEVLGGSSPPLRIFILVVGAQVALARGELTRASELVDMVMRTSRSSARDHIGIDIEPLHIAAQLKLHQATGDAEAALPGIDALIARLATEPVWPPMARVLPAAVDTWLATGRGEQAREFVDRFSAAVAGRDAPLAAAALRYAYGAIATGEERRLDAAEHFLAAAALYQALQCPYEAAQARERAAVSLFEVGGDRAPVELKAAAAAYQTIGASWDLDRVLGVARAYGLRMPPRYRGGATGYGDRLSPRESEVARLAATGHTNKQIAAQLYLSVGTVKKQLAAAMRKLGVRSRLELARQAAVAKTAGMDGPPGP